MTPSDPPSAPACPTGFQKPTEIVAFLNETYRQACIEFFLDSGGGEKDFDFDRPSTDSQGQQVPPDGCLNTDSENSPEWVRVNTELTLEPISSLLKNPDCFMRHRIWTLAE